MPFGTIACIMCTVWQNTDLGQAGLRMTSPTFLQLGNILRQLRKKAGITSLDQLQETLDNDRSFRGSKDTFPISREYLSAVEHGSFLDVSRGLLQFYRRRGVLTEREHGQLASLFDDTVPSGTELITPADIPGLVHARTLTAKTLDVLACTSSSILPWLHLSLRGRAIQIEHTDLRVRILLMQWNAKIYADTPDRNNESYEELRRAVRRWQALESPKLASSADLAMLGPVPPNLRLETKLCHNTVLRAFLFDNDTDAAEGFLGFYEWQPGHLRGLELPMIRAKSGSVFGELLLAVYTNRYDEMWLHGDRDVVPLQPDQRCQ